MAKLSWVIAGTGLFLLGYFFTLITQWIMPPLITFLGDTLGAIIWIGTIILWTLTLIVIPLGIKIYGLTSKKEEEKSNIFLTTRGILYGLFTWLLVYVIWYAIPSLASMMNNNITLTLFWIGLLITILFDGIGVPAYTIIDTQKHN